MKFFYTLLSAILFANLSVAQTPTAATPSPAQSSAEAPVAKSAPTKKTKAKKEKAKQIEEKKEDAADDRADGDLPINTPHNEKAMGPAKQYVVSPEEQAILNKGELSMPQYIVGGIVGSAAGFGIGHAVQSRYREKGWIFTAGDTASLTVLIIGLSTCETRTDRSDERYTHVSNCSVAPIAIGLAGLAAFRIWEVVDVWVTPPVQNRRYREIRERQAGYSMSIVPTVTPKKKLGLAMNISF